MSQLCFHGNLTLEKFFIDWFGNFGRELGSNVPHPFGTCPEGHEKSRRMFTDSYKEYLDFVRWCKVNQRACWITGQPMRYYGMPLGIEKIFLDFDYKGLKKNQNMTKTKRDKVKKQVIEFVESLPAMPLIVATRKGFHVYVFLRRVYEFKSRDFAFAKDVFGVIGLTLLGVPKLYEQLEVDDKKKWKYLDFSPLGDIVRMARVPLTAHEKTGVICQILDRNLEPTKIRSLDFYRSYGLQEDSVREAAEIVKDYYEIKAKREQIRIKTGVNVFSDNGRSFQGQMRPCFTKRLRSGEMVYQQRLAFLIEAYYSGIQKEEELVDLCRNFGDFVDRISRYQVRYFLAHNPEKFPPYRCKTIERLGWCLKSECQIYRKYSK